MVLAQEVRTMVEHLGGNVSDREERVALGEFFDECISAYHKDKKRSLRKDIQELKDKRQEAADRVQELQWELDQLGD